MGSRDQSKYAVPSSAVKFHVGPPSPSPRGPPVDQQPFFHPTMGGGHPRGQRERSFVKPQGPTYWKPGAGASSPTYFPGGRGGGGGLRVKPGREIYQPPPTGTWNPEAPSFAPVTLPSLTNSRSVDLTNLQNDNIQMGDRAGLTITFKANQKGQSRTPVMRRSNTVAITGINQHGSQVDISGLGRFSPEVEATINKSLDDPNRLSGRSLMELVKHIFTRMVENQKMAEPAARLCIFIIERETKETFLESLLNTCQEWFHERETILMSKSGESSGRWVSFMSFLNEMYGLLKRKQLQLMTKYEGVPPKLVLLSLLGECCTVSLTQPSLNSVNEVECLFFILTHIGRDMELETPGQMTLLLASLKDAFLHLPVVSAQVRKTLLQLIELQAAGWQLPAQSVMYYYPGANLAT